MRVLVNATTLVKGGGLQVAASVISEALRGRSRRDWLFAVSRRMADELARFRLQPDSRFQVFDQSPARSKAARRDLKRLEQRCRPDAVFTVFGPSYVQFDAPHLLGCALGWVTHATWLAYRTKSFPFEWAQTIADSAYKAWWLRQADAWVVESEIARQGLCRRLRLPQERIAVVSNTCHEAYFARAAQRPFPQPERCVRLLSLSAAYPHKCLDLIPKVAKELSQLRPTLEFQFVVTLPQEAPLLAWILRRAQALGVIHRIQNVGPVAVADGPALYETCDVSFTPTVLETFSAAYPEAMAMGLPVVTSGLDFARDICGDAAAYFRPRDARSAAEAIASVIASPQQWASLLAAGKQRLTSFPTPQQRFQRYEELLASLHDRRSLRSSA
jgi:glycosyltransferase involved in cell wall biosynthesis